MDDLVVDADDDDDDEEVEDLREEGGTKEMGMASDARSRTVS